MTPFALLSAEQVYSLGFNSVPGTLQLNRYVLLSNGIRYKILN